MTSWDFLFAIIEVFGTYAGALILIGVIFYFVGPRLLDKLTQKALIKYGNDQDQIKNNKNAVFNRLHERKLDAFTDLFSKMILSYQKFKDYTNPLKIIPPGSENERFKKNQENEFFNEYRELKKAYLNSLILIPDEIDQEIKKLFDEIDRILKDYMEYDFYVAHGVDDNKLKYQALKKQLEASKYVGSEFPKLLDKMRERFRNDILKHDV
jgi:hypothetical protein